MSKSSSSSSGIGLAGMLTVLFVALKLTGFIAWSWWWVVSPIFISIAIWIVVILVILLIATIFS